MPIGFQGVDLPGKNPLGWGCATGAKYEQRATLLRHGAASDAPILTPPPPGESDGTWHIIGYHPVTGEPIRDWVPVPVDTGLPDNPDTPEQENLTIFTFSCEARGIITGGLNSQGTTERFTSKGDYENVDFVELKIPADVTITKRDRITNITNSSGQIVWREEEHGTFRPTVFDVLGVTPVLDPFGSLVEWFALIRRAEKQGPGVAE